MKKYVFGLIHPFPLSPLLRSLTHLHIWCSPANVVLPREEAEDVSINTINSFEIATMMNAKKNG